MTFATTARLTQFLYKVPRDYVFLATEPLPEGRYSVSAGVRGWTDESGFYASVTLDGDEALDVTGQVCGLVGSDTISKDMIDMPSGTFLVDVPEDGVIGLKFVPPTENAGFNSLKVNVTPAQTHITAVRLCDCPQPPVSDPEEEPIDSDPQV